MPTFNPQTGAIALLRREWIDATRQAYQDCSQAILVGGVATCEVIATDGSSRTSLDRANSGLVTAGGGLVVWKRNLDGVIRDTRGRTWSDGALAVRGVSPDGAFARKVAFNSWGPWDVVEQDDSVWALTGDSADRTPDLSNLGRDANNIQLLGSRRAIWTIGEAHCTTPNLPIAVPTEPSYGWRAAWIPEEGQFIALYQRASDGALVCDGHVVAPPSAAYFYYDIEYRDGVVRITWATTQADADSVLLELPLAQVRALPPSPPAVALPTFAFAHPVLVAPFKDPHGQSAASSEIVVNQTGQTARRPYIVADDSLDGPFAGSRLGIYTEATDLRAAVTLAAGLSTRVFAGHDGPDAFPVTTLAQLRPWDVPLLECYLVAGETATVARWTANLRALLAAWPGQVGVIPMCYCGGGAPPNETFAIDDVLRGLAGLSALVNLSPRVTVIAPFAYLRANGITAHPELMDAFSALLVAAAQAGLVTLPSVEDDMAVRPGIRVVDYGATLKAGQEWAVDLTIGVGTPAATKVQVRIDAAGDLWVTTSNAAGSDATGVKRHVQIVQ